MGKQEKATKEKQPNQPEQAAPKGIRGFFLRIAVFFASIISHIKEFFSPELPPASEKEFRSVSQEFAERESPPELEDVTPDENGILKFPAKTVERWPINREILRYLEFIDKQTPDTQPSVTHNAAFARILSNKAAYAMQNKTDFSAVFGVRPTVFVVKVHDGVCEIAACGYTKAPQIISVSNPKELSETFMKLYASTSNEPEMTMIDTEKGITYQMHQDSLVKIEPNPYHFQNFDEGKSGVAFNQLATTVLRVSAPDVSALASIAAQYGKELPQQEKQMEAKDFHSMVNALHMEVSADQQNNEHQQAFVTRHHMFYLSHTEDGPVLNVQSLKYPTMPPVSTPLKEASLDATKEARDSVRAAINNATNQLIHRETARTTTLEHNETYLKDNPLTPESSVTEQMKVLWDAQLAKDEPTPIQVMVDDQVKTYYLSASYYTHNGEEFRETMVYSEDKTPIYQLTTDENGNAKRCDVHETWSKDAVQQHLINGMEAYVQHVQQAERAETEQAGQEQEDNTDR